MTGLRHIEKRSSEHVLHDIDCSHILAVGEIIANITSLTVEPVTVPPITLGVPVLNASPATYTDRYGSTTTAPAGTVIQVAISGGTVPTGRQVQDYTVRARFATALNPAIEAVLRLRVRDQPNP